MSGMGLSQDQVNALMQQSGITAKSQNLVNQDGSTTLAGSAPTTPPPATTGNTILRGGTAVPPPTTTPVLRGATPAAPATPTAPAPGAPQSGQYSVPSFTSTLGSGQTWNPTDSLQAGINAGYQQNAANGIAVPPSNFARWQTYPASVALNKSYQPLGGATQGGVGGTGGAIPGGPGTTATGGSGVFGTNPGPIPGNPGNGSTGFTPNAGVLAPPTGTLPGGTPNGDVQRTFGGFRIPTTTSVPGISPSVITNFNTLMATNPDKAYSYLLAQPEGGQLLQAAWGPQWNDPTTGADLEHQIIETHTLGAMPGSKYDPTAQYYGVDPSTLNKGQQHQLAAGQAYNARQAAKASK